MFLYALLLVSCYSPDIFYYFDFNIGNTINGKPTKVRISAKELRTLRKAG